MMRKRLLFAVLSGAGLVLGTLVPGLAAEAELQLNSNDGSTGFIIQDSGMNTVFEADSDGNVLARGTMTVTGNSFSVGGNSLFISSAGNVGIGTTTPLYPLHVLRDGAPRFVMEGYGTSNQARLIGLFARGNLAAPTAAQASDILLQITGLGYDGNVFPVAVGVNPAMIRLVASENQTSSAAGGRIQFHTTPNASTTSQERMRITDGGNVGIGTTNPTATLEVKAGGTTLADAWTVRSSEKYKTNIRTLEGALEKVEQLRGVSYDRKLDGKHEIGIIAEEVAEVLPEIVAFEKDGKEAQGVDYARLSALLIEAVKEQQVHIKELKNEIATLKRSQ